MAARVPVVKTYKLFINGQFPRSESGRSIAVTDTRGRVIAHVAQGSRKDLRDAVEAARLAQPKWAGMTAYNRGQVLYRMAEMLEGAREEFVEAVRESSKHRKVETSKGRSKAEDAVAISPAAARREVDAAIDRLVCFSGWADKYAQVLGCANAVSGPYYNFTIPEPTGIVAVVAPDEPALLGLVSLLAPPLCAGNAVVAISGDANPLPAAALGEVCATSDVPPGVANIITGRRGDLLKPLAEHREVNAISAANLSIEEAKLLQSGMAENLKRVRMATLGSRDWFSAATCESPWTIEPFVEMKTIWHPSAM